VSEKLFSFLVNRNLEVRTSVAINPVTGTSDEGKLFSYEALPRSTWLANEVVQDNYRELQKEGKFVAVHKTSRDHRLANSWHSPLQVAQAGLRMMESLGVGGMGTRGFGRLKVVSGPECGGTGQ
jgi:CRISPR-associated protein Cmr4